MKLQKITLFGLCALVFTLSAPLRAAGLEVRIAPNGPNLEVTFPTQVGFFYTLEVSENLSQWDPGGMELVAGTGDMGKFTYLAPAPGEQLFFRVVALGDPGPPPDFDF